MFFSATLQSHKSDFRKGIIAGISIALGYLPVALTFGFIAETTGLSLLETIGMSAFVFAGAAQYMSLSLLAVGTGALEIIFTTFIINIRHLLMSTAISEKAEQDHPLIKAIYAFGITDEVFAVTSTKEGKLTSLYIGGVALIAYSSWVINSGIGYVIGTSLPQTLQQSMSIALYALFIALLVPSLKKHRKIIFLAVLAAILNSILTLFIPSGWAIIIATLASAILIEFLYDKKQNPYENQQSSNNKNKESN
ncbi:AzlC family ABC transporter permease [Bacillaceae bacterium IKA-2]|nr:AzlC family ABC transporter permease [Bacillaceae bacterium IKA-2]